MTKIPIPTNPLQQEKRVNYLNLCELMAETENRSHDGSIRFHVGSSKVQQNSSCATWRESTVVPEFLNKWPIASCFLSDVFHKFLQLDLFSMLIPGFVLRIFVKKLPLKGVKWHPPPPQEKVPSLGTMSTSNSTSVTKRRDDDTVFLAKFSPAIFMEGLNLRSCCWQTIRFSWVSIPKWS